MPEVTRAAIAGHLNCSGNVIDDYVAKGVIKKLPSGKFDEQDCRNRAFDWLRDKNAGRTGLSFNGQVSLSEARAKLTAEQFEAAAIKNAVARGDYVSLDEIIKSVTGMLLNFRNRILSIPGKIADACEMRTREEIEVILVQELSEALDELSVAPFESRARDHKGRANQSGGGGEVAAEAEPD